MSAPTEPGRARRLLRYAPVVATPRTMASTVGALFVVAGALGAAAALIVRPETVAALVTVATAGVLLGVLLLRFGASVPMALLRAMPTTGLVLITLVVLVSRDERLAHGYASLYAFVVLDAYLFFHWRFAAAHWLAGAVLHLATTVGTGESPIEAALLQLTLGAIGLMVGWLVRQAGMLGVDPVTSLPERRVFDALIEQAVSEASWHDRPLCVALLDLDEFGEVNRRYGAERGDQVLVRTAAMLTDAAGRQGAVCRYGSDEFAVLLVGLTGEQAVALLDRLRAASEVSFAASVTAVARADTRASITRRLVTSLHQASRAGSTVLVEQSELAANRLLDAIASDELELHYQPIVPLGERTGRGAEALVRWRRAEGGYTPPDAFVPQAERDGTIVDLGRWVLDRACADLAAWRDDPAMPDHVSVNVSYVELARAEHADVVLDACRRHGVPPSRLVVEVTETTLGREDAKVVANLRRLRDAGVAVSIDDFGTGHSSLARLHVMPVTELKIDRAFVADLRADQPPPPVLAAIVALANALDLEVVAEGVEEPSQLRALIALGVQRAQGYLLGRPVPVRELGRVLARAVPTQRGALSPASDGAQQAARP